MSKKKSKKKSLKRKKKNILPAIAKLIAVSVIIIGIIGIKTSFFEVNSTPKSVAINMVSRLSNKNFDNIAGIINVSSDAYIDDGSFLNYLKAKNINLTGNKTISVINEDKKSENFEVIKILTDNNVVMTINTVKINNKWYVDLKDDFDKNIIISVPKGSTVKINKNVVSRKYVKEKIFSEKDLDDIFDYTSDVYTIPSILRGKYNLSVTMPGAIEYTKEIDTTNSKDPYVVKLKANDKKQAEILKEVSSLFNKVVAAKVEGKDFSTVSKYYFSGDGSNTDPKMIYDSIKVKKGKAPGYVDTYSKIVLGNFQTIDAYLYGTDMVYITGTYKLIYTVNHNYNDDPAAKISYSMDSSTNENFRVVLVKKDGTYSIKEGVGIVPLEYSLY